MRINVCTYIVIGKKKLREIRVETTYVFIEHPFSLLLEFHFTIKTTICVCRELIRKTVLIKLTLYELAESITWNVYLGQIFIAIVNFLNTSVNSLKVSVLVSLNRHWEETSLI
jgi:hypothetical protein